jgi:2-polyprenyl-3-methyl-5-hydroxy-6-metoxy-1,4-benzoquinol methylase
MYAQVIDEYYLKTEKQRQQTFEEFLDLKERFCPERGTLLDVGCNTGIFLKIALLRGYHAEGIELSNWAVAKAQSCGLKVRKALLKDLAREHKLYDTITAFDVMEHLSDPFEALIMGRSLLREGGCFIATVPDMNTWHARLLGSNHWLVIIMHYQYFTRHTFARLLQRAGFSRFKIVTAPPYRIRLGDAANYTAYNKFFKYLFNLLCRIPFIQNMEIRLKASLFCVAWK